MELFTCKGLVAVVGEHCGYSYRDMRGPSRLGGLVRARRLAAVMCQRRLGASGTQIGRALNRDRSTVVHHLHRAKRPDFDWSGVESIEKTLRFPGPVDNGDKRFKAGNGDVLLTRV